MKKCNDMLSFVAIMGWLITSLPTIAADVQVVGTLAQAQAVSSQTGKPIFAVAGRASCPHCVKLIDRLKSDKSLAKYGPHFVMIKVSMDDDPAWKTWEAQYPVGRNAIPKLYVVRSDGKQLHADVGAPSGDSLPRLLEKTLQDSAVGLAPDQTKLAQSVVEQTQPMALSGHWSAVMTLIQPAIQTSGPAAHSPAQIELTELFQNASTELLKTREAALEKVKKDNDDFESLVVFVDASGALSTLPELAKQNRAIDNKAKRIVGDEAMKSAEGIAEARQDALSSNPKAIKRAVASYAKVLRASTNDAARTIAADELRVIERDHEALSFPKPTDSAPAKNMHEDVSVADGEDYRYWTSAKTGSTITAKLLQQKSGYVQLQTRDGKKVSVALKDLSDADQEYARKAQ